MLAAGEPNPKTTLQIPVPGENPNIYLRMPLKELLQQRKNAKPFVFFDNSHHPPDPEVLTQTLIEHYEKSAQFQDGLYFVQHGFLLAILLGSYSQGKIPFEKRQELLSSIVKAYGQPDAATVVELGMGKHAHSSPAFFWHLSSVTIAFAVGQNEVNSIDAKNSSFELKMYVDQYMTATTRKKVPFNLPNVTPQQWKAILAPLRAALTKVR